MNCTCGSFTSLHGIECMLVAADQPNVMVNDAGEVFYPDNADDAARFAAEHDAYLLRP